MTNERVASKEPCAEADSELAHPFQFEVERIGSRMLLSPAIFLFIGFTACGPGRVAADDSGTAKFPVKQGAQYSVREVPLPPDYGFIDLKKINNAGAFVGTLTSRDPFPRWRAFVWNGELTILPNISGARDCFAGGINDDGMIVGSCDEDTVVWRDGEPSLLFSTRERSSGSSINSNGDIVGTFSALGVTRGYVWNGSLAIVLPTSAPECISHAAVALNDRRDIVGNEWCPDNVHPVWWRAGQIQPLDSRSGDARDVNNNGQVAGILGEGKGFAVTWQSGKATVLGPSGSGAYGINNQGQIVGGFPATLWSDGAAFDLNTLISESGVSLLTAFSINDSGQIVVLGDRAGSAEAVLLTPQP